MTDVWLAWPGWILGLSGAWVLATLWLILRRRPITVETVVSFAAITTLALVFLAAFSALAVMALFGAADQFNARPLD